MRYVRGLLKPYASSELYDSARVPSLDMHLRRMTMQTYRRNTKSKLLKVYSENVFV